MPERFKSARDHELRLADGKAPQTEAAKKSAAAFAAWRSFAERMTHLPVGFVIKGATKSNPSDEIIAAYEAPFPDASYKAGAARFPLPGANRADG